MQLRYGTKSPGRAELEEFPAEGTERVFIGTKVEQSREAIEGLLRSCEVR